jgi:hypothetical protein
VIEKEPSAAGCRSLSPIEAVVAPASLPFPGSPFANAWMRKPARSAPAGDRVRVLIRDPRDVVEVIGIVEPEPLVRVGQRCHQGLLGGEVQGCGECVRRDAAEEALAGCSVGIVTNER